MDFLARQAQSQRRSRWLLAAFALAVLTTVAAINLLTLWLWQFLQPVSVGFSRLQLQLWLQHPACWWSALLSLALLLGTSLLRYNQLRSGGSAVAMMLGGREIQRGTTVPREQQLLNIVDEMAIAARRVPPRVFIIDGELALNAFVAGSNNHNMALAVTEGLLANLNRDEIQGVVGHEFSHIVHGDVQLNTQLIAYLAGLLMVNRLGRLLLRISFDSTLHLPRRQRRDKLGAASLVVVAIGIALWLIGWMGWMAGRLIQAAVSRQREFLADASAVQFTRQTKGLAGALQKILANPLGGRMLAANASEISHICIANSVFGHNWLATHPPLEARIRALKPWFRMFRQHQDGRRKTVNSASKANGASKARTAKAAASEQLTAAFAAAPAASRALADAMPLATASDQRQQLEQWAGEALHQPATAGQWLLALLVANQQHPQTAWQASQLPAEQQLDLDLISQKLADLPSELRLPLLELLLATARQQPQAEREQLETQLIAVIDSDGDRSLFDLLTLTLWQQQQPQEEQPLIRSYRQAEAELHLLFSALAHAAPGNMADATFTFAVSGFGLSHDRPLPASDLHASDISNALQTLANLHPQLKPPLLAACRETALSDNQINAREQELLVLLQQVLACE